MIIKQIRIKNFRSYYGETIFDISPDLTLIIGDNGDGKTTFFEALQWLFDTTREVTNLRNFSEKRLSELEVGESDELLVAIDFEHDGSKSIEKSFVVERQGENKCCVSSFSFRGYETSGSERVTVSGKQLMDRCFDAYIQRYSMFKGESTLNVFNNPTALRELVDKYSDLKKFDIFVEMLGGFVLKAENAYMRECRNDDKVSRKAKSLQSELQQIAMKIAEVERDIRVQQGVVSTTSLKLEDLEKHKEAGQRLRELKDRIQNLRDKCVRLRGKIDSENFNLNLLDQLWVLCAFPEVLHAFQEKCANFARLKREQNETFIKEQAKRKGGKDALERILALDNGSPMLPWNVPDEQTMQEMLRDHICKVCGRPFEEGSEAHRFMVGRLEEYRRQIEEVAAEYDNVDEEAKLFQHEFIEELHHLSITLGGNSAKDIAKLAAVINDRLGLVEKFKQELRDNESKLKEADAEKIRLLIQTQGISEAALEAEYTNMKGYYESKSKAERKLEALNRELAEYRVQQRDLRMQFQQLNPSSGMVRVYKAVHETLDKISSAFVAAKEKNLATFLQELANRANDYMKRLNASDFHGVIRLIKTVEDKVEIKLFSSNNSEVNNPSGSQQTTMYMSVLFAISDLTTLKREENYPLIFDAATSSFGDSKEERFYNIIDKIKKQCIIVTKDFITKGDLRLDDIEHLSCTVYRIKKKIGFNATDLSTICTVVEKVK